MSEKFDLAIIGSGPGGYVCAIRAAQLGMKVAVVEKRATHGGTCLNVGCIPSKALLHASELFEEAHHSFAGLGIRVEPTLDLEAMLKHKTDTVSSNTKGIAYLFKQNKITAFHGSGVIDGPGKVTVTNDEGADQTIETQNIVIATGSAPAHLKGIEIDEKRIVTSTGALDLQQVPKRMLVIGAGVIGLEIGSVWSRLGSDVTVVEFLDRILPGMDSEIAKYFQRILKKQGIKFQLGTKITAVDATGDALKATVESASGGDEKTLEADIVLVAIGRIPVTDGLGLEKAGVALDDRGRIKTDALYNTNITGIYAIGDVIAGPMLAHKAEDEGVAVAEILAGKAGHVNYRVIPGVVYTNPEVAYVGQTEEELNESGIDYKVGKFSFTANGRAKAMLATDGFVKILADRQTDRVLGAHIVGKGAGDMIHELAVLMEFGGSAEDLARTCHAHPTMSEAVREAALGCGSGTIHM